MRKLTSIFIIILFLLGTSAFCQTDTDHKVKELIARDVMGMVSKYVQDHNFSLLYDDKYYHPMLLEISNLIRNYNDTKITQKKYKILQADVKLIGDSPIGVPKLLFIILTFHGERWEINIWIKHDKSERII